MTFLNEDGLRRLWGHIKEALGKKVDKIDGMGLSTNDFTTEEKEKLAQLIIDFIPLNIIDEICGLAQVLEGDGANYYMLAPTALSFCSEAPLDELAEIQIDGEILDSSNYTLTEGSTIATLPISYLQTLAPGQHTVKIVSKSMAPEGRFDITQPELNQYGFYWNQPYVGYNNNAGQDIMFLIKADGTFEGLVMGDGYPTSGSYTINENEITLDDGGMLIYNLTITASGEGKSFTATNGETFNLDEAFVSDGEFMYIYDEYYKGYRVRAHNKDQASYGTIKTGIYDKPTVTIYQDAFNGNSNLIEFTIPEGIIDIEGDAFQSCDNLEKVVIPKSIKYIRYQAFCGCNSLNTIIFNGTISEWNNVSIDEPGIFEGVPATEVQCSDGTVAL